MPAQILNGNLIARQLRADIRHAVEKRTGEGKRPPGLAVILVGNDPASLVYVGAKRKDCERVGFHSIVQHLSDDVEQSDLEERVIALARAFAGRADFVAISANDAEGFPDDAPAKMAQRARVKDYPFPYLYDETQAVARAYGAACTPDFFLYGPAAGAAPQRRLAYRGRFDDNWQEPERVEHEELRDALEALLTGEPVAEPQLPALGCNIKWRE